MTCVSTTTAVLALWGCFGALVCSLEYHRGLPAGERLRASVWGSSCYDWISPGARPQYCVSLTVAATVILNELEWKSVYEASRNTSHAFAPHLPYSAICCPTPDSLTSPVALFVCPAPGLKLALHLARWLAVDCSKQHPRHKICHFVGVPDSLQHRYCRLHAPRRPWPTCLYLFLKSLTAVWTASSIPHRQHRNPPISSSCTCGNTCVCFEAGPAPTGCGYSPMCLRLPSVDAQKLGSTIWSARGTWRIPYLVVTTHDASLTIVPSFSR